MLKLEKIDEIKKLLVQKTELYESNENKRRLEIWGPGFIPDIYSPGQIVPYPAEKRIEKKIPIVMDWDRRQWSQFFGFNISEFYKDPVEYLRWTLKIDIYRFSNFDDDTPILKTIPITLGCPYEASLFGVKVIYSDLHEPLFKSDGAVVKTEKDLSRLKIPNFKKDGLMPLAYKFFEKINKIIPEDFEVIFPKWGRGPIGMAFALAGMEDLLIKLIDEPKFVHKLMRIITDSRIEYTKFRRSLINKADTENALMNDEATIPIISKDQYEEFGFPYENEIAIFNNGIGWWHACGNKTPLIPIIKKIKNVKVIDINWWTDDIKPAISMLNGEIPFIIRPSARDITEKNECIISNYIDSIINVCGNENYAIRLDAFQPTNASDDDAEKVKRFLKVFKNKEIRSEN